MIKSSLLLFILYFLVQPPAIGQMDKSFPLDFKRKADLMGIEFFYPIERKIKSKKIVSDDFMEYDLVLRSRNDFEIRYSLVTAANAEKANIHPHVELTRTLASIATNDEEENIRVNPMSHRESLEKYGADWGIFADFVPKKSFSNFRIGRIVSLYKEGSGYLNCIILYKKDNLGSFVGTPVRFSEINDLHN